jgi:hypothetical protein
MVDLGTQRPPDSNPDPPRPSQSPTDPGAPTPPYSTGDSAGEGSKVMALTANEQKLVTQLEADAAIFTKIGTIIAGFVANPLNFLNFLEIAQLIADIQTAVADVKATLADIKAVA